MRSGRKDTSSLEENAVTFGHRKPDITRRSLARVGKKHIIQNSVYMERYRSGHNEAVLKTVWVQAHGGSNPSLSAKKMRCNFASLFFAKKARDENMEKIALAICPKD